MLSFLPSHPGQRIWLKALARRIGDTGCKWQRPDAMPRKTMPSTQRRTFTSWVVMVICTFRAIGLPLKVVG